MKVPVPTPVEVVRKVPYFVEKPVPYPVHVPIDRPVVHEKHVPLPIHHERPVEVQVPVHPVPQHSHNSYGEGAPLAYTSFSGYGGQYSYHH